MFKHISCLVFSGLASFTVGMTQAADTVTLSAVDQQLRQEVGALLQKKCERDEFSGAVLIAKHGQVLFESVCGEASQRYHVPNKLDTKFNIASVGKMFTAVAIAQLVEAGRLSYDDKLDKFLDVSWLPAAVSKRITVGQLLNHTSGLPEFLSRAKARHSSRAMYKELVDMKPLLEGLTPSFPPGTRYSYSNTGYLLLGAIIEKLSGENYFSYVRQHIYQPAGMQNSDSYALDDPVDNLAMGYMYIQKNSGRRQESSFEGLLRGSAFGCGYSTLHDLLRFSEALNNGSLLKPESLQVLWQNHTPGNMTMSKHDYGYGFQLHSGDAGRVVGHSGHFTGARANFDMYQDAGYVVILLSNYELKFPLAADIEDLIVRAKALTKAQANTVSQAQPLQASGK